MTVFGDIGSVFTVPWNPNTAIWIVISGIIGGIVTQVFKFVFEQTIPEWQRKKATRIAIEKYQSPIYQSAFTLSNTIKKILDDTSIINIQESST